MTSATDSGARTRHPISLWRWVLVAAVLCFCSTCWSFTRAMSGARSVDVAPAHTLLPLLLLGGIALAGRGDLVRARRALAVTAAVIILLTAVVLPIVINHSIDAGRPVGAWPLDWIVPVDLQIRKT